METEEVLLYDYGAEPGDVFSRADGREVRVEKADYVDVGGTLRKRIETAGVYVLTVQTAAGKTDTEKVVLK